MQRSGAEVGGGSGLCIEAGKRDGCERNRIPIGVDDSTAYRHGWYASRPSYHVPTKTLSRLQPRVLRHQLLDTDGVESDGQLDVVVLRLGADDVADPELHVPYAHADPNAGR